MGAGEGSGDLEFGVRSLRCLGAMLTAEEVAGDYRQRRDGILKALVTDQDKFYQVCDPEKENLCLYGHSDASWEVNLPAEEVPPEMPEPSLGINFARNGMQVDSSRLPVLIPFRSFWNREQLAIAVWVNEPWERGGGESSHRDSIVSGTAKLFTLAIFAWSGPQRSRVCCCVPEILAVCRGTIG